MIADVMNVGTPTMGLIAKHHRHDVSVTRAPPSGGPKIVAPTVKILMTLLTAGLCRRGKAYAIILKEPAQVPPSPDPAIARPMMSAMDICAVALTMEPISNTTIAHRKQANGEKMV